MKPYSFLHRSLLLPEVRCPDGLQCGRVTTGWADLAAVECCGEAHPMEGAMWRRHAARAAAVAGAIGLAVSLAGCAAKVSQEQYDSDMAKLREEMQAGDRNLAGWLDSTNRALADHERRLDALEQEMQALRREYQVSIEKMKGSLKFNIPVHFDFDQSDLREGDLPVLDRFAN